MFSPTLPVYFVAPLLPVTFLVSSLRLLLRSPNDAPGESLQNKQGESAVGRSAWADAAVSRNIVRKGSSIRADAADGTDR